MEHETKKKTGGASLDNPSLKLQAKHIRHERAHCKIELLYALQEVKDMRKHASVCEKRARASEVKAKKLAKKAELAVREALIYKQVAEQAWHAVVEVQNHAENKRKTMKAITAKLHMSEQKARQVKKSIVLKQKLVNTSV